MNKKDVSSSNLFHSTRTGSLALEAGLLAVSLVLAFLTRSTLFWIDTAAALERTTDFFLLYLFSDRFQYAKKFKYNYGTEKAQALLMLSSKFLVIICLPVLVFFAIRSLIHPSPLSSLFYWGTAVEALLILLQGIRFLREYRRDHSRFSADDLFSLGFRTAVVLTGLCCRLTEQLAGRSLPAGRIASAAVVLLAVCLFIHALKKAILSLRELADRTLPEKEQLQVIKALNSCFNDYEELIAIQSRRNGRHVMIDLLISFDEAATYAEIRAFLDKITGMIQEVIPESQVALRIVRRSAQNK